MKHAAKEKPNYKILCRHTCESVLSEHTFQKEIPYTDNVLLCWIRVLKWKIQNHEHVSTFAKSLQLYLLPQWLNLLRSHPA